MSPHRPSQTTQLMSFLVGLLLVLIAQQFGLVRTFTLDWPLDLVDFLEAKIPNRPPRETPLDYPEPVYTLFYVVWPLTGGLLTFVIFGPKYTHNTFKRMKGASVVFGNIPLNRNAKCRGSLATGKTGSGKTVVVLNNLYHSQFTNECGVLRPTWHDSATKKMIDEAKAEFRRHTEGYLDQIAEMSESLNSLDDEILEAEDLAQSEEVKAYITSLRSSKLPSTVKISPTGNNAQLAQDIAQRVMKARKDELPFDPSTKPLASLGSEGRKLAELRAKHRDVSNRIDRLHHKINMERLKLQKFTDKAKMLKYIACPWGGVCFDEKGLYWQTLVPMASVHDREDDLMLLQTRPEWAGDFWTPPAKFNLLSDPAVDSDSYAKMIVDTAMAVEGSDSKDPFFPTQAQIQIGWGIKLMRAAQAAQLAHGEIKPPLKLTYPSLTRILEILTIRSEFDGYLAEIGAEGGVKKVYSTNEKGESVTEEIKVPPTIWSPELSEAIKHLSEDYWAQPEEQRGGVASTIYNYLIVFAQPDVAEVFCGENSFDLNDIQKGKIVCLAMPQKLAVHRRYICTIIKQLTYSIIERRFDLDMDSPAWKNRNLIDIGQDEAQKFAIRRDGAVDTIREASGTTIMLSQTHHAIYQALGGAEKGAVIMANLANRYICTAALESCAEESAKIIGKEVKVKKSKTYSKNGNSTSESEEERYIVSPLRIKTLPDFYVYFVPCEGSIHYRLFIMQPVKPDGRIPDWWFGTYNPIECVKVVLGRSRAIPFWKSKAPFSIHAKHLLGMDTTYTVVESRKRQLQKV